MARLSVAKGWLGFQLQKARLSRLGFQQLKSRLSAKVFIQVKISNSQGITYDSQTLAHDMTHEMAKS